jgi:hypothetical protein
LGLAARLCRRKMEKRTGTAGKEETTVPSMFPSGLKTSLDYSNGHIPLHVNVTSQGTSLPGLLLTSNYFFSFFFSFSSFSSSSSSFLFLLVLLFLLLLLFSSSSFLLLLLY